MKVVLILILIGLIQAFSPGFSFILACCLITVSLIWYFAEEDEKIFLIVVFLLSFAIRISAAAFLHFQSVLEGWEGYTSGDERLYWEKIKIISEYGLNSLNTEMTSTNRFSKWGTNIYTAFIAILHSTLGFHLLVSKFVNSFFGALLPIIIYYLSINLFEKKRSSILQGKREKGNVKKIAMLASLLIMVFPSLIRWSASGIKESLIIFIIALMFLILIKSHYKIRWYYPPVLICLFFLLVDLQKVTAYVGIGVFMVSFFIGYHMSKKKYIILFLGMIMSIPILSIQRNDIHYKAGVMLYEVVLHQVAQATSDDAGYLLFPSYQTRIEPRYTIFYNHIVPPDEKLERFMVPEDLRHSKIIWPAFLFSYFKGLIYAFLSPFPWSVNSPLQLQAYPQMVLWYMLFPFALFGGLAALRDNPGGVFPVFLFMFLIGSILALSEGNIGGVFRHRDWLTPFYLIFGSAGLVKVFNR